MPASRPALAPGPLRTASLTTLRLGGPARRFVDADSAEAVVAAVRAADAAAEPVLLLGGGSNVVIADAGWPGVVVRVSSTGFSVHEDVLTVEAGEHWDDVVAATVAEGLGGLECLSGIPGRTGATPVQNVGAYGVEIADLLVDVDLYDRAADTVRDRVPAAALGLAYRTSALKGRADAVVLRVRLRVRPDGTSAPIRYAELAGALGVEPDTSVPAEQARQAVLELRRGKGMVLDPADHDTWSVGSFFTNPVVAADAAPAGAPRWAAGAGRVKLSAAWLIQHAGFDRGHPGATGHVALSGRHVLALTHRGGGTTAELLDLARELQTGVLRRFGILLTPEPVMIGCGL